MIRAKVCPLAGLGESEAIQICLLTCARHSSRHRPGAIGKGIVLKTQILLWDIGVGCYGVSLKFLIGILSGVFQQILLILIDGFHVVVAEDRCLIGVAADKDWDPEFFAFGVNLCGLLWKYPSVDDGIKMNLSILAPDPQNFGRGNTAELTQCIGAIGNSQVPRQLFSCAFASADDQVVGKGSADVFVEDALAIPTLIIAR